MPRASSAYERLVSQGAHVNHYTKFETKDSVGTWRDVSALSAEDYLMRVQVGEHVEQQLMSARVTLRRQSNFNFLSPLMTTSALNSPPGSNYIKDSENPSSANWSKSGLVYTPNATIAPDGTTTAYRIAQDTILNFHYSYHVRSKGRTPLNFTASAYFKQDTTNLVTFYLTNGNTSQAVLIRVDLATGTISSSANNGTFKNFTFGIVAAANGFYRVWVSATSDSDNAVTLQYWPGTHTPGNSIIGNGLALYGWGFMLEPGLTLNPYVKTTGTAIDTYAPLLDMGRDARVFGLVASEGHGPGTNLILWSEDFTVSNWGKGGGGTGVAPVVTANYATAPDGNVTADRIQFDKGAGGTASDFSQLTQALGTTNGIPYRTSFWAKTNDASTVTMRMGASTSASQTITITPNWQRFWSPVFLPAGGSLTWQLRLVSGSTPTSNAADISLWGAMAVQSAEQIEYIQTTSAAKSNYREIFQGRVNRINWDNDPIEIECTDTFAWIADTQIETEGVYGGAVGVGRDVELVVQDILNAWPSGKGVPALYTPTTPAWKIENYKQSRDKVLEAGRALVNEQYGWDLRGRYDAADAFRLTNLDPQRTRSTIDYTFSSGEYDSLTGLELDLSDIRNVGKVFYKDSSGVTQSVTATDATSISRVGRRYFEISTASQIRNSTDASVLINNAVSDLATPPLSHVAVMMYFPMVQLYDRYTFLANGVHYDQDQTLAVVGYEHVFEDGTGKTTIYCAGKITGGYSQWQKNFTGTYLLPPSLDVTAAAAASNYVISYSAPVGVVELSINGAAYSTAPASPITVTRPAAGSTPLEYSFRLSLNEQTVVDMVTIQPIDVDTNTVTPDLSVVPSLPTATTQKFTASATNPAGGTTPTIFVRIRGTTGVGTDGVTPLVDGTEYSMGNGLTITVDRPSFGTAAQASVEFRATITGQGTERIQRSILTQVKTSFGPSLDVVATPGAGTSNYTITWSGTAGTQLSINGGAYGTPPASPISVARPAAGAAPLEYSFRAVLDSQTVVDTVTIQPVDVGTTTPDLAVVPSTPTDTTQDFTPTAVDPTGATTPSLYVRFRGTTGFTGAGASPNGYSFRGTIVVDHTKVGATLTDFPVLVSVTSNDFKTVGNGGKVQHASGFDIRFEDTGGTKLDHDIQSWNGTTGQIIAWVRIPSLSSSVDTTFYVFAGKAGLGASEENKNGTWVARYGGVYHDPSTGTDSSGNGVTGTPTNVTQAAGKIGNGAVFDGSNSRVTLASNPVAGATAYTWSAWFRAATNTKIECLFRSDWWFVRFTGAGSLIGITQDDYSAGSATGSGYDDNVLRLIHFVGDGTGSKIYMNGVNVAGENTAVDAVPSVAAVLGALAASAEVLTGLLNEVRFQSVRATPAEMLTEYNNQSNPATFMSVGAMSTTGTTYADGVEYAITGGTTITANRPAFGTSGQASVEFRATITGNGTERIQRTILNQVKTSFGPSLDVTATPGAGTSNYTIVWSGNNVQLSINGGSYGTPPASPISVARPSVGSAPLEYSFRGTLDGQVVVDTVTVQPVDASGGGGVPTPDLTVVPGNPTTTTQDFTLSATDPAGSATPVMKVTLRGTTGVTTGLGTSLPDGTQVTISASDATIRVNRPAFGTTVQASMTAIATIAGGGTETIQRTIPNQVKTTFGGSLDVKAVPGSPNYSIIWTGGGGTVELSIDGGTYATAPASPISVARPSAGSQARSYAFRVTADGQTTTDEVTIPAIDKDTVTPDLVVTQGSVTATTVDFTYASTNPAGGAAPAITVRVRGLSGSPYIGDGAYADGTEYTVTSGSSGVTIPRAAFGTTTAVTVEFKSIISGQATERIQRTIPNQVKTVFGPSLTVQGVVNNATQATIYWTGSAGTVLSIDGGSGSTPPTSPIVVSRPAYGSPSTTYAFYTPVIDGQQMTAQFTIPSQESSAAADPTALVNSLYLSAINYGTQVLTLTWDYSGTLTTGAYFQLQYCRTPSGSTRDLSNGVGGAVNTTGTSANFTPSDFLVGGLPWNVTYSFRVVTFNAANQPITASDWFDYHDRY